MKSVALALGALLTVAFLAGCTKKPVEFKPTSPAQTNIMAFMKQKVPNLVVVMISEPPKMPAGTQMVMPGGMEGGMPMPYRVELASPKDDSMRTMTAVMYDDKTQKIDERTFLMPPAPTKRPEAP